MIPTHKSLRLNLLGAGTYRAKLPAFVRAQKRHAMQRRAKGPQSQAPVHITSVLSNVRALSGLCQMPPTPILYSPS